MWEIRERFVMVYFKNDFFPFLQSTRSERHKCKVQR
jgi:hypothetical protein